MNQDSAFYRVFFEYVGSGNGDYVLDSYNAQEAISMDPVAGVSQGDYVPSRSIITPKKQQMISSGFKWSYSINNSIESEWALSNTDRMLFHPYRQRTILVSQIEHDGSINKFGNLIV